MYTDSVYTNLVRNCLTTKFIFIINRSPVIWNSRKQIVTAQSLTEIEYMTILEVSKQAIQIYHFLYLISKELVYNRTPTTIYKDNQDMIKLIDNPINYLKTKHIAVYYHTIQEYITNSKIQLEYLAID